MKTAIAVISIVLVVIGLFLWRKVGFSRPQDTTALVTGSTQANFADTIPAYDFGSVSMMKGNVEHEFAIKNTTDADLIIDGAETSCMCTEAILKLPDNKEMGPFGMPGHGFTPSIKATVRPGETFTVRAIFDPAAHGPAGIGKVERQVTLSTNKGPIIMQFQAQVTP